MQSFKQFLTEGKIYKAGWWAPSYEELIKIFEYDTVNGDLTVESIDKELTTLENFPSKINGNLKIDDCKNLTSLEGGPLFVRENVTIFCPKITSLSGIGKRYFKEIQGSIWLSSSITSSILGILIIKNLKNCYFRPVRKLIEPISVVSDILFKHLHKDKDVMECHEELTRKGLKEYAKF